MDFEGIAYPSEESSDYFEDAQECLAQGQRARARRLLIQAMEDPRNLDADRVYARYFASSDVEEVSLLLAAEERGREILKQTMGETCFDDNHREMGYWWGQHDPRPYIRVVEALCRTTFKIGQTDQSLDYALELLRLDNDDKIGIRELVPSLLLQASRPADALSFVKSWLAAPPAPPRGGINFTEPVQEFIPAGTPLGGRCDLTAMLYSGALAAFRLWGNCDVANQYLDLACNVNPRVLVSVMGGALPPTDFDDTPFRSPGTTGRAEAQDYLFLTQSLWVSPDVQEWVSSKPEIMAKLLKGCGYEGCDRMEERPNQFKACTGCHENHYCRSTCKRNDSGNHRAWCLSRQAALSTRRASAFIGPPRITYEAHHRSDINDSLTPSSVLSYLSLCSCHSYFPVMYAAQYPFSLSPTELQVNTPPNLVQCQIAEFGWHGATSPYKAMLDCDDNSGFSFHTGHTDYRDETTWTWQVYVPFMSRMTCKLTVTDGTGQSASSDSFTITGGPAQGCPSTKTVTEPPALLMSSLPSPPMSSSTPPQMLSVDPSTVLFAGGLIYLVLVLVACFARQTRQRDRVPAENTKDEETHLEKGLLL